MTYTAKRKGITPIVAIVILLLITVAIAGSAYTWLGGYYTGLTGKSIQVTDITCTLKAFNTGATPPETAATNGGDVIIRFTNIGTSPIAKSDISITRTEFGTPVSAFPTGTAAVWKLSTATSVNPGTGAFINDSLAGDIDTVGVKSDSGITFKYFIEIGGRTTTNQVTC